jgi:hypothetical protein
MSAIKEKWMGMSVKKRRTIKRFSGLLIGAVGGFTYYALIGCQSGSCPITSNPWISTGWGALIGITAAY